MDMTTILASLSLSFCCLAAAGTAMDAGTDANSMNRVQMELTIKRVSIVLAAVTILSAAPALSPGPEPTGQPCQARRRWAQASRSAIRRIILRASGVETTPFFPRQAAKLGRTYHQRRTAKRSLTRDV